MKYQDYLWMMRLTITLLPEWTLIQPVTYLNFPVSSGLALFCDLSASFVLKSTRSNCKAARKWLSFWTSVSSCSQPSLTNFPLTNARVPYAHTALCYDFYLGTNGSSQVVSFSVINRPQSISRGNESKPRPKKNEVSRGPVTGRSYSVRSLTVR